MSKANSPIKVLRTALKRVQKGWTKSTWHYYNPSDGTNYVCLEGAIYGYCPEEKHNTTPEQRQAINVVREIVREEYGYETIPTFNDAMATTKENVMEVIKLGIVRLETGGEIDDKEFDDLLEWKDR